MCDIVLIQLSDAAQSPPCDPDDLPAAPHRCGLAQTQVVAKIESTEGLLAHEEIIKAADGVVFSRGNLGVCLDAEKVRRSVLQFPGSQL